jgi:hypothetical protein
MRRQIPHPPTASSWLKKWPGGHGPRSRVHPVLGRCPSFLAGMAVVTLLATGCGGDGPPADEAVEETRPPAEEPALPTDSPHSPEEAPAPETPPDQPAPPAQEPPPPEEEDPPADPLEDADPEAMMESAEGTLGVTGTGAAPTAILRREEGGSLGLTGAPARELMALSGARVRVYGRRAATPVGRGLEVTRYELLEIEGRTPVMGILGQDPAGNWILHPEDGPPVTLTALPGEQLLEGMKIWVVGSRDASEQLVVESYGVISVERP